MIRIYNCGEIRHPNRNYYSMHEIEATQIVLKAVSSRILGNRLACMNRASLRGVFPHQILVSGSE